MRQSGILLHPTSLPGDFGIGDLGAGACRFADFLAESGCGLWQVLPLGPTGFGHSPYQAYSAMGGNPLLVSLQPLVERGLLAPGELASPPLFPGDRVDFDAVIPWRKRLLGRAARAFFRKGPPDPQFERFCADEDGWLEPFARFAALREAHNEAPWTDWDPGAVPDEEAARAQKFIQFEFFRQWRGLRAYCRERGIRIIGDLPIFVAHDSADVWAHRALFDLDERGRPLTVAGVPPDYFSATGQLWGNPLYRWGEMERTGYRWWIERVRAALGTADIIRLDHFRGFEKYYEIPGGAADASVGRWVPGPGERFFAALEAELGPLPFIAEDLGYITPGVLALRDRLGFPGMRVLQFAFGDESRANPHKPYNFTRNSVVYTGTHDNDTTAGWFAAGRTRGEAAAALRYMGTDGSDGVLDLVRLALGSVADTAVIPMQDLLGLGSEARMNTPSTVGGNWLWRMRPDALTREGAARLREMNRRYGRGGV